MFTQHRRLIVELAARNRLPTMYGLPDYVDDGGLMFYGASLQGMYYQAATFVDKILKGAKPGDLPVEQPTKFELIINLRTAKALGPTIPPVAAAAGGSGYRVAHGSLLTKRYDRLAIMEHRHDCVYCATDWFCYEKCPIVGPSVCTDCREKILRSPATPRRVIALRDRQNISVIDHLAEYEADRLRQQLTRRNPGQ